MRHTLFVRAAIITALAVGGLTACAAGGEPTSSARVAVKSSLPQSASVTAPPSSSATSAPAAAPKPVAAPPASSSTSAAPPTAAESSTSDNGTERLAVATHPKLGKIVTDDAGMTLYRLDSDPARATKSSCVDDCAKVFPPVTLPADGTVDVTGIDAKLVGQLKRPDGTIQLTLAGRLLYRFVGDSGAGDALGHGLTGASALTPTGAKAVARAS